MLISNARIKPKVVIARAGSFRCKGIVIKGVVIVGEDKSGKDTSN